MRGATIAPSPDGSFDMSFRMDQSACLRRSSAGLGLAYLVSSIVCSFYYIGLLAPSVSNDLWWPAFNASGVQTFLGDVYHARLALTPSTPLDLFDVAMRKDYSRPLTYMALSPSYPRQILLDNVPLESAIAAMRAGTFTSNIGMVSNYCWVDLDRRYELAHTAARQARCLANDGDNAAVYLETLLRNVADVQSNPYSTMLNKTLFSPLEQLFPDGAAFVRRVMSWQWVSVPDEVALWRSLALTRWQTQLQNMRDPQFDETIVIRDALGLAQVVQINKSPQVHRGANQWTTAYTYCGFWNDLMWGGLGGFSVVRNSNVSAEALGIDWDLDLNVGREFTPVLTLVRRHIGPYHSIDVKLVPPPQSLIALLVAFDQAFVATQPREAPPPVVADPVPTSWTNMTYHGGNPTCVYGDPMPYVQDSFGFYDACGRQDPLTIHMDVSSSFFALMAVDNKDSRAISAQCVTPSRADDCADLLAHVRTLQAQPASVATIAALHAYVAAARVATERLNVSILQFASSQDDRTLVVLTQLMLPEDKASPWTFFGWITLYDWLRGQREVYRFEGDVSTVTIMSRRHNYVTFQANPLELPQSACRYLLGVSLYASLLMTFVVALMIVFAIVSAFDPLKVFHVNRVAGFVWVGRPFLFVRGMTAVVLLSTSQIAFVVDKGGMSRFAFPDRSLFDTMVVAGEATWVSYVLSDLVLPLTKDHASRCSGVSSGVAWMCMTVWSHVRPVRAAASIDRKCHISILGMALDCHVGQIELGDASRLVHLLVVQTAAVGGAYFTVRALWPTRGRDSSRLQYALPGPTEAFLTNAREDAMLDPVACIMSGMIPFRAYLFDVKLWVLSPRSKLWRGHAVADKAPQPDRVLVAPASSSAALSAIVTPSRLRGWLVNLGGFAYIVCSVVLSYKYLGLTESTMANDFWWANFNSTGAQPYLANWFNSQLQLTSFAADVNLNDVVHADWSRSYNLTVAPKVDVSALYANHIQDDTNTLVNVIQGLRRMDGCDVPTIFTSYCFVDFGRTWELARSTAQQQRCRSPQLVENGAIYMEGVLRNAKWAQLMHCWGSTLDSAVFRDVRSSAKGLEWVVQTSRRDSTDAAVTSVAGEVQYWRDHGVTSFRTLWQNSKRLGVVESFSIENALGVAYSITIKHSNGTLQEDRQTSFKMYWGFARDLQAVAANATTVVQGRSLVRGSPRFAWGNVSLASVMVDLGTLGSPLGPGLSMIQATLGPFGTTSIVRVACPRELVLWYKALDAHLRTMVGSDMAAQAAYAAIHGQRYILLRPLKWQDRNISFVGGNVMCDTESAPQTAMLTYFSTAGSCMVGMADVVSLSNDLALGACLAVGSTASEFAWQDVAALSRNTASMGEPLQQLLVQVQAFGQTYLSPSDLQNFHALARAAHTSLQSLPPIEMVQYLKRQATYELGRLPLFDAASPSSDFVAWAYMIDWVKGYREVVTFQGDVGQLTTISAVGDFTRATANPQEIPRNVAAYIRHAIMYVTLTMGLVATCVCVYTLASRGLVEGLNMFVFKRVAGQVWVGRPLLLLRAVTAIWLLSTSTLDLTRVGIAYRFVAADVNAFAVWMASGEVTWLVYILNDTFSVFTQEYMYRYSFKSSLLVWTTAFVWNVWQPVQHTTTIRRECQVEAVDFQVVCHSGRVAIGDVSRVIGLVALTCACCVGCFVIEVILAPRLARHHDHVATSALLHGAATFGFSKATWIHRNVYYMDKASAIMTGVLTIEWRDSVYVFDVKTWRLHVLCVGERRQALKADGARIHLVHAIPMLQ